VSAAHESREAVGLAIISPRAATILSSGGQIIMMQKGISEIAGQGTIADGSTVKLYRALRTLLCEKCGAEIREGTLFTRWPLLMNQAMPIMPHCR
jgi:hypothetical protein